VGPQRTKRKCTKTHIYIYIYTHPIYIDCKEELPRFMALAFENKKNENKPDLDLSRIESLNLALVHPASNSSLQL
jgi:hypothetical protein